MRREDDLAVVPRANLLENVIVRLNVNCLQLEVANLVNRQLLLAGVAAGAAAEGGVVGGRHSGRRCFNGKKSTFLMQV